MGAFLGLLFGVGLVVAWRSGPRRPPPRPRSGPTVRERTAEMLAQAGIEAVTPGQLYAASAVCAVLVFLAMLAVSHAPPVALAFAVFAAVAPFSLVRYRRRQRTAALRELWPEVVDNLASAVRAGLSLPEALAQVGVRGPEPLRRPFTRFGEDHRATGRFADSLDRLKAALADRIK